SWSDSYGTASQQDTQADVCFGSKADICGATSHVRFTPNCDRKSGYLRFVMSALPPRADMCSPLAHVRFGPIVYNQTTLLPRQTETFLHARDGRWVPSSGKRIGLGAVQAHQEIERPFWCWKPVRFLVLAGAFVLDIQVE